VGPKLAEKLAALGIHEVEDLLFHLPMRYQDRTRVTPIGTCREGQEVLIDGEVQLADVAMGRRRSLVVRLRDGSGGITCRFFHFSAAQKRGLSPGTRLRCFGQVRRGSAGPELYHPEYRVVGDTPVPVEAAMTPVYPGTAGISQQQWRKLCGQAIAEIARHPPRELLPDNAAHHFSLSEALRFLHAPPPDTPVETLQQNTHPAQLRLALEELVAHHLTLQQLRRRQRRCTAPPLAPVPQALAGFLARLPFDPTTAQRRVIGEISTDLEQDFPMLRLVQGDVGSGKTLVAAAAAIQAVSHGYQVAIMAPTEILAEQHWQSFRTWFEPLGITVTWLSGRRKGRARAEALDALADGTAAIAVGTHALFQSDVAFARLGLVIVDEQHRFGVHQRLSLTEKAASAGGMPHQLVMTATPIPRTLAMVAYADLDSSVIDELPPGRQPVNTLLVENTKRDRVVQRVAHACETGQQAYWVCTLVEESDQLQAQAAEAAANHLREALPNLKIGLIHGRMKPAEKDAVMAAFKQAEISLLVATTVIEVGVDVPNASLMVIENPERLGLAQLHQLRGRIGRGGQASHCVLLYQSPLSAGGRQRLQALRESTDGFRIAEQDLALRGPGEVLGTRQTGLMNFRVAKLPLHDSLLPRVAALARGIQQDPEIEQQLVERWTGSVQRFGHV
jgi:ATP-dependent DNA helicase RecG